jgi:hypothetical protein
MVIESSKDYGTGNVLMILDGETSLQEIADYLCENHGEDVCAGDKVELTKGGEYKGLVNPPTAYFIKSNS